MRLKIIKYIKENLSIKILRIRRSLRRSKYTRIFGKTIFQYDLWHFSLRSVTLGAGIGTFIAFTPTYGVQIPLSILAALIFKVNLPITILMCLVTNPFTIPFIYYYQAKLGMLILGSEIDIKLTAIRNLSDVVSFLIRYSIPLWFGSIITSTVFGSISYLFTFIMYRFLTEKLPHHKYHIKSKDKIFIDNLDDL